MRFAVNPLQLYAGADGMLDFAAGPGEAEILAVCRDAGFSAVQADAKPGLTAEVQVAALADAGLTPAPPYFSAALSELDGRGAVLERFDRQLSAMRTLQVETVVIADDVNRERFFTAGRHAGEACNPGRIEAMGETMGRLAHQAAAAGATACLHPHVGSYIESPEEIDGVMDAAGAAPLTLCPDTGHLAWGGVADVRAWLAERRDRIGALHLKDMNRAVRDRGVAEGWSYRRFVREGLWREPGLGDLDLAGVLDDFAGSDLWCVVEVDAPHQRTAQESLAESWRFVSRWAA